MQNAIIQRNTVPVKTKSFCRNLLVNERDKGAERLDIQSLCERFEGFCRIKILIRIITGDWRTGAEGRSAVQRTCLSGVEGELCQVIKRHAQQMGRLLSRTGIREDAFIRCRTHSSGGSNVINST